jgi:hypothetical protein
MLNVIMLGVIMLGVIMLGVIMLSVVAPKILLHKSAFFHFCLFSVLVTNVCDSQIFDFLFNFHTTKHEEQVL